MKTTGERSLTDTPCKGVCTATALGDDICKGCGRTKEEVINWNSYTSDQKIAINKRINSTNTPLDKPKDL